MKSHRFDPLSFSFGVIYTLIGLLFLIPATPVELVPFITESTQWVWPLVVVGLGIAILVPLVRSNGVRSNGDDSESDEPDESTLDEPA